MSRLAGLDVGQVVRVPHFDIGSIVMPAFFRSAEMTSKISFGSGM